MITALTWVPKGAARAKPVRFELSQEEYARVKSLAKAEEEIEKEAEDHDVGDGDDPEHTASGSTFTGDVVMNEDEDDKTELPPELRMDEYDDDSEHEDNEDDDNDFAMLEQGDIALAIDPDEDDEDAEDDEIRVTDSLLVVAITEDEYSHLEVQLLADDGTMFIHHDISLPEFPLCLAWLDCPPFQADGGQIAIGNYIAVGTFEPAIEIWNLDVLDPLEPTAVLGGLIEEKKFSKKGKGKKGKKIADDDLNIGSHEAAVMGLSWNKKYRQAIASGSADMTVKIWDVTTQACQHTFEHHRDKVQSVVWHYDEAWLLASGAFDQTVALLDCRTGERAASYTIPADIESMTWDPFCPFHLYCSLENGEITCIDIRIPGVPLCTFQAHGKTTSGISFSSGVPGLMASSSIDKTVKLWDVANIHKYYTDDPYVLATAGDKGSVAVWECDEAETVKNYFQDRAVKSGDGVYTDLLNAPGVVKTSASAAKEGEQHILSSVSAALALPGHKVSIQPMIQDDSWMDEPEPTITKIEKKTKKVKSKDKDKAKKEKK